MRVFRAPPVFLLAALMLLSFSLLNPAATVEAAVPGLSGGYTQNFDTLANTGDGNSWVNEEMGLVTLPGWRIISFNGAPPSTYRTSNSQTNGSIYSWGSDGSSERALGSITSGSQPMYHYSVQLDNDTDTVITAVTVSYRGEQWVIGGSNNALNSLTFDYQVNAAGINQGTWTSVPALDFVSPKTASAARAANDGNSPGSFTNLNATINLTLQPGASLWLRWTDIDNIGSDHGLAIDDLVVTINGAPVPTQTPAAPTETPAAPTQTPIIPTNAPGTPGACSAPDRIYELQEGGAKHNPSSSPSPVRTVSGVVVGDFQTGLEGFYIQDPVGDGNPATSDGIFVYDPPPLLAEVSVGQRVIVTGSTIEFKGDSDALSETEIIAQSVTICDATPVAVTPIVISLPIADLSLYERYEGMLVQIVDASSGPLTVSETFTLARFGEVVVSSGGRLFQPTMYTAPGTAALDAQALNDRRRILIDDGQNGTPANGSVPYIPATDTAFRLGFTTQNIVGILEYSFNNYRVQPTMPIAWTPANPRPAAAPVVESDVRIAAMNVLNFFNGDGAGGGFPTSRGADTSDEFARQKTKTAAAIMGLNADIIVLNEIENDNPSTQYAAIEELTDAVNSLAGGSPYTFIDMGVVGTDVIRISILYRPAAVQPVGGYAMLSTSPFSDSRPSVAQLFEHTASGERFYIIGNHFKSKGCSDATGADRDQNDGQSCYNATRIQMSNLLADWIAADTYFDADPDVLIVGDLNAYALEDPIETLKTRGFVNLVEAFLNSGEIPYSFTFSGQSGTLDYAFASVSMVPQIVGAADWHINADEPIGRDYNDDVTTSGEFNEYRQPYLYQPNAFRSADHDPLLMSIRFDGPAAPPTSTPSIPPATSEGTATPTVPAATPTPTQIAALNLIVNDGFEARDANQKPELSPWTLRNGSRDKVICDKTPSIAFQGTCAFRFKGGDFERAALIQKIDLAALDLSPGDTLKFSVAYHMPKEKAQLKVKAIVAYTDPQQPKGSVKQTLGQTAGYQQFSGDITLRDAPVKTIKVKLTHQSPKGKAFVDAVRLEVIPTAGLVGLPGSY